jgi:hypothetical protein
VHGTICESGMVPSAHVQGGLVWSVTRIFDALAAARDKARAYALFAIPTAMVVTATFLASSSPVIALSSLERQAQCELSAIRDTRSSLAVQRIRSACNWLALNGDSLLNERNRDYYVCLVQQLSGVQADQAAGVIVSACRTSFPP